MSINSFEEAKKLYESIVPIRQRKGGKCRPDIRPLLDRRRPHYRIIKVSDDEYAVSCSFVGVYNHIGFNFTPQQEKQYARSISFHRDGSATVFMEPLWPQEISPNSGVYNPTPRRGLYFLYVRNFINDHLPSGMKIEADGHGKEYLNVHGQRYKVPDGGLSLRQSNGTWLPENPEPEYTYRVTKDAAAKAMETVDEFRKYIDLYWDIAEPDDTRSWDTLASVSRRVVEDVVRGQNLIQHVTHLKKIHVQNKALYQTYNYPTYRDSIVPDGQKPSEFILQQLRKQILKTNKHLFRGDPLPIGVAKRKHWLEV